MSAALHPHPEARFQTVEEMQSHLRRIVMRQDEQARRFMERQKEIDALHAKPPSRLELRTQAMLKRSRELAAIEVERAVALQKVEEAAARAARKRVDIHSPRGPQVAFEAVETVAKEHGVSFVTIMSRDCSKRATNARLAAILAVKRALPHWGSPRIGQFFNRDRTTVSDTLKRLSFVEPTRTGPQIEFLRQIQTNTIPPSTNANGNPIRKACRREGFALYVNNKWHLTKQGLAFLTEALLRANEEGS